eukprot:g5913.t1
MYRPVHNILTSLKHNSTKKKKPSHFAITMDINLSKALLTVGLVPNNNIIGYDPTTLQPTQHFKIKGPNLIRQIKYSPVQNDILSAVGKGGMYLYDVRAGNFGNTELTEQQKKQQHVNVHSSHCLAFGLGGNLIANGMENGWINFYDIRNYTKILGQYKDAHNDAVLSLKFDTNDPTKLYTTSADGTASFYDVSAQNEDDAFIMCYNANCDIVHAIPFKYNNNIEYVVLITSVNTVSIWNVQDGECIVQYNQFPGVDYLLANGYYDRTLEQIVLFGGAFTTHNIIQVSISLNVNGAATTNNLNGPMERVSIDCIYTDSHYGLVRDICVVTETNHGQFYSCGEDALITHWRQDMKYSMKHKRSNLKRKGVSIIEQSQNSSSQSSHRGDGRLGGATSRRKW